MSDRLTGLFINPETQCKMIPAKHSWLRIGVDLPVTVPRSDYDAVLSCMHIVCYEDPCYSGSDMLKGGIIVTNYGLSWILQHDLTAWWLTDSQLAQVIKYYGLDKYWE